MIQLSDSALKYAVDVCGEIPNYRAYIYVRTYTGSDEIRRKLRTYLKNRSALIYEQNNHWRANYENGSIVMVIVANDNARGYACNIAIVDTGIDTDIIDTVIRPQERLQEMRRDADEQNNGFTDEHERALWENLHYTFGEEIHDLAERIRTNAATFEAYRETHNEDNHGFTITDDPLFPIRWEHTT